MVKKVKAVDFEKSEGRAERKRLKIKGEDGKYYYVKPWHNESDDYNFCNSSRPFIVSEIANALGFQELCPYAIIFDIGCTDKSKEFFGLQHIEGSDFRLESIGEVKNKSDLVRIFLLDILLFYNDRKTDNINLFFTKNKTVVMIDLDNFFNFSLSKNDSIKNHWNNMIKTHPLFNKIKNIDFKYIDFINKFKSFSCDFLKNMPEEWHQKGDVENIKEMLTRSRNDSDNLIKILEAIEGVLKPKE